MAGVLADHALHHPRQRAGPPEKVATTVVDEYPLVWAHGLCSSVAHEDDLALFDWPAVTGTAPLVRYDARGHGTSLGGYEERCYRWSALVDDMMRAAGDGPFVAGGVGMGAATALFAALRAPLRTAALVLALPPAAWEERAAVSAAHDEDADLVEMAGPQRLARSVADRPLPPLLGQARPRARELQARHLKAMDEKVLVPVLRAAARSDLPARDQVHTVIVPTLILAWPDDPVHPLATAGALAELMVQADLRVARHTSELETWTKVITEFVADAV